jgi:hypothetical protein
LIIRGLCTSFEVGGKEMEDWSIFGFLYGTIPPAPPTVIYAAAFGIQEDLVNIVMISIRNHRSIFSHRTIIRVITYSISITILNVKNCFFTYLEIFLGKKCNKKKQCSDF